MQNCRRSTIFPSSVQSKNHCEQALKIMKQLTNKQKKQKVIQLSYKTKSLKQINQNLEIIIRKHPSFIEIFTDQKLIVYVRYYFIENLSKIEPLVYFRLIMISQQVANKYLTYNIPIYIARLLEKQDLRNKSDYQEQAYEALRLIQEWVYKYPKTFPRLLAGTLVAYAQLPIYHSYEEKKKDHISSRLKLLAFQIILDLTTKNTKMCISSGGFLLLSNAITDPSFRQKSYEIVCRVIYFLNEKKNRQLVLQYIDIRKIFSIFTDLDNVFAEESYHLKGNLEGCSRLRTQLSLAKISILTLLKSWIGIIYLGNEKIILQSFLQALKQIPKNIDSQIRKTIYQILQQILNIGNNLILQNINIKEDQFRVYNLINCYMITLVQLLLQHDLFKILIQLSGISQNNISDPAKKILKKLSVYIFNFFPNSSKYFDFLISAVSTQDFQSLILKSSSAFIVNQIGNYIYQSKNKVDNNLIEDIQNLFCSNTIFIPIGRQCINSIKKSLNYSTYQIKPNLHKNIIDKNPILKQNKDNYKKWDWHSIQQLLNYSFLEKDINRSQSQRQKQNKLLRYIVKFLSYEKGNFSQIKWNIENFQYIRVGKLFIKSSITVPHHLPLVKNPPQSQFQTTISLIGQLEKQLTNTFQYMIKSQSGYYMPFFQTFYRQLILWIGLFSQSQIGLENLLCQNNFFDILYQHVQKPNCGLLISCLLFYFNYSFNDIQIQGKKQNSCKVIGPKALLQKCVKNGSKRLKISCLEIIRLLFKAQMQTFYIQGFKLILYLLCQKNLQIISSTTYILQDILKQQKLVSSFIDCILKYQLQSLEQSIKLSNYSSSLSSRIKMRIISLSKGFELIHKYFPTWLQQQYAKWVHVQQSQNYCLKLQKMLSLNLNFVKNDQNTYRIRRSKNFTQMIYLYKIPWLLLLNDQQVPLWVNIRKNHLELIGEWNNRNLQSILGFKGQNNNLRISLCIGNMHVDQQINIKQKPFETIIIGLNQGIEIQIDGQQYYLLQKNQIKIYLQYPYHNNNNNKSKQDCQIKQYLLKKIVLEIKIQFDSEFQLLPMHLIQQLIKTKQGQQFLNSKQLLKHTKQILQNPQSKTIQIRSILWSMGYYGSNNVGIRNIIEQQICDAIIQMSFNCEILSLRGTCRYVLNMFCHSQIGRNYLNLHNYQVNKKYLNCFPLQSNKFYYINFENQNYKLYCQQQQYWSEIKLYNRNLNQNQNNLYNAISMLLNSLSGKIAVAKIKQLMKKTHKITHSYNLYQNVINLMTFYRFRYQSRKNIHLIFQQFFRSSQFNNDNPNKIKYVTQNSQ